MPLVSVSIFLIRIIACCDRKESSLKGKNCHVVVKKLPRRKKCFSYTQEYSHGLWSLHKGCQRMAWGACDCAAGIIVVTIAQADRALPAGLHICPKAYLRER